MLLKGKKIVLGVTGGIAVYKAVDLVSRLRKQGAEVRVVMTEHARQFVTPLTFKEISGNAVATSMWNSISPGWRSSWGTSLQRTFRRPLRPFTGSTRWFAAAKRRNRKHERTRKDH